MTKTTLISGALVPHGDWCAPMDVLIKGSTIDAVCPVGEARAVEAGEERETILCDHETRLLLPGLHNAHTHSSNFFIKGGISGLPLELMVSCGACLPPSHAWKLHGIGYGKGADPAAKEEQYRIAALATGIQNILSGATSLVDMISLPDHGELGFRCLAAAAKGFKQSGVRVFLGPQFDDSMDNETGSGKTANFLAVVPEDKRDKIEKDMRDKGLRGLGENGGLRRYRAPTDPKKTAGALALWRRAIEELHNPAEGVHIILSPHNELTCSENLFRGAVELMKEFDDIHATVHVLEGLHQPIAGGPETSGANGVNDAVSRSVRILDECGFLTPRTTLAHCVHLTRGDMKLIASRGCTVSHNPISNLRLGAGIADTLSMLDEGVNVGIGIDGAGSGVECQDMLSAAKLACLLPNVKTAEYRQWLRPRDVLLEMGCRYGRAAVGLNTATGGVPVDESIESTIAPGAVADLVLYDLTSLSLLPRADPFTSLLLGSGRPGFGSSQVVWSWVAGRAAVRDGDCEADIAKLRKDIMSTGPNCYPPADVPANFGSPYEVEYRAVLGLPLEPPPKSYFKKRLFNFDLVPKTTPMK